MVNVQLLSTTLLIDGSFMEGTGDGISTLTEIV
jgi:hypothetical protein